MVAGVDKIGIVVSIVEGLDIVVRIDMEFCYNYLVINFRHSYHSQSI